MRAVPLLLCAGAAALSALGAAAVPALAEGEDPGAGALAEALQVSPAGARPGGDVYLRTRACGVDRTGTVASVAFVSEVKLAPASDGGGLTAEAVVKSGVAAGSYTVRMTCAGGGHAGEGRLVVVPEPGTARPVAPAHPAQPTQAAEAAEAGHSAHRDRPVAPVPAGGGGTAVLAADPGSSTAGPVALGAAAGLAVAGSVSLALHRRRRTRAAVRAGRATRD